MQLFRIFIFQRDFRLEDNSALEVARVHAHESGESIMPIFVFDPAQVNRAATKATIVKKNKWRSPLCQEFMSRCLVELAADIARQHGALTCLSGDFAATVAALAAPGQHSACSAIYYTHDYTPFAVARSAALVALARKLNIGLYGVHDHLILGKTIANKSGGPYLIFGAFYRAALAQKVPTIGHKPANVADEAKGDGKDGGKDGGRTKQLPFCSPAAAKSRAKEAAAHGHFAIVGPDFASVDKEELVGYLAAGGDGVASEAVANGVSNEANRVPDTNITFEEINGGKQSNDKTVCALPPKCTRAAALAALAKAVALPAYAADRDTMNVETGRLSHWIKFGLLSVREVYWAAKASMKKPEAFLRQLYWRDFFYNIMLAEAMRPASGPSTALVSSYNPKFENIKVIKAPAEVKARLTAWRKGMTGFPIVDAAMTELNKTGYMHNRGRLIVASFLTRDLLLYWRLGEQYFARKLIDYDPTINNMNWQTVAGSGPFALKWFRIMNPWRQGLLYDPDAEYIKKWIPALASVPAKDIHRWHEAHERYTVGYRAPMCDHAERKVRALAAYKAALGATGGTADSDDVGVANTA
jgi:deoxyribodipyrimidine photolyase